MTNQDIEQQFPNVSKWVRSYGRIEIGMQEHCGFLVRALDEGGLIFESDDCSSLGDSMAALESGLTKWFDDNEYAFA